MERKSTIAERMRTICHISPLLAKARGLGLCEGSTLLALAVRRGCRHYGPYVEALGAEAPSVGANELSDEELIVALLLGSWEYDPVMIRVAAQMMGGEAISPQRLARLAMLERCEMIVRYIAECGEQTEPGHAPWPQLLSLIPEGPPVRAGALPHPSRFRSETGVTNPRRPGTPRIQWLRPAKTR